MSAGAASEKLFSFFSRWILSKSPNPAGEYRMFCPIHEDPETSKSPSASINFAKGVFNCQSSKCVGGMSIASLKRRVQEETPDDGKASYNPFAPSSGGSVGASVVDLDSKRASRKSGDKTDVREDKPLTEALIRSYHRALMEEPKQLAFIKNRRSITDETIVKYSIGFDPKHSRFWVPIRDENGVLVNARKYKPDAESSQKMWNHLGYGSPARLFPIAVLSEADDVLLVEGEFDAMICNQNGIPAMTGTGGANKWEGSWGKLFSGKNVFIMYDNDRDGRVGAKRALKALEAHAKSVRIVPPLMEEDKSDVTDFFQGGGTAEQLKIAMHAAPLPQHSQPDQAPTEVDAIDVIGSMDATTNGRGLAMTVSITGFRHPTYSIPHKVEMFCTMDAGPKCKGCCMLTDHEGETSVSIEPTDAATVARFIDCPEEKRLELLRQVIGAQRCNRLQMEYDLRAPSHSVNEVFVATNVDRQNQGRSDYAQRRVFVVGNHQVETNSVAKLTGTTWPNPKDSRNEFYAHSIEPATTSLEMFTMTPELRERLTTFQPGLGQKPIDKCRDIADDLSKSVTMIRGRERLLMCMDLVYHSVLNFKFEGKLMDRGWLEFIVVGDTRTGKSKTAIQLTEYYRLGRVIGCEGATYAGLIGGVKQIGGKDWAIQWGEITINDRRLVVLDEASGLSQEIISRMSDVRARGVAQVTAIETRETKARCRLIWISNPRASKYGIDEKRTEGVDILENVIGNPEDIARFDFAMSVRSDDVRNEEINTIRETPLPSYASDDCHDLILWAWSRSPEQVVFSKGTTERVYEGAKWLADRYVSVPQLIQGANVRDKIVRIAVAIAARTFSTDKTGELLIVSPKHVADATNFLHKIYSYDNFGYYRRSQRIKRNLEIAKQSRGEVIDWFHENPKVLGFFIDRAGESFRSQDLEEMLSMGRDEVNQILSYFYELRMISKNKSQIVIEPELQDIVKRMERRKK